MNNYYLVKRISLYLSIRIWWCFYVFIQSLSSKRDKYSLEKATTIKPGKIVFYWISVCQNDSVLDKKKNHATWLPPTIDKKQKDANMLNITPFFLLYFLLYLTYYRCNCYTFFHLHVLVLVWWYTCSSFCRLKSNLIKSWFFLTIVFEV